MSGWFFAGQTVRVTGNELYPEFGTHAILIKREGADGDRWLAYFQASGETKGIWESGMEPVKSKRREMQEKAGLALSHFLDANPLDQTCCFDMAGAVIDAVEQFGAPIGTDSDVTLKRVQIVADAWNKSAIRLGDAWGSHATAMILTALYGATEPGDVGLSEGTDDWRKYKALSPTPPAAGPVEL